MKVARLKSNDTVLVHAAAGGVGTAAVQIAKNFGCNVIGTASKNKKIEMLNNLGIDMAINYLHEDFEEIIKHKMNNNGVDVVLEVVGGEVFKKSMKLLNPFGRTVVVGFASLNLKKMNPISWVNTWKDIPRAKVADLAESSTGLLATHLGYLLNSGSLLREVWDELVTFTIKHGIKPIIGHRFEFDDLSKAHELMESRNSYGKIIISLPTAL
jgi:NADPH2:quinone reductase